jgi:hypothetical protein
MVFRDLVPIRNIRILFALANFCLKPICGNLLLIEFRQKMLGKLFS